VESIFSANELGLSRLLELVQGHLLEIAQRPNDRRREWLKELLEQNPNLLELARVRALLLKLLKFRHTSARLVSIYRSSRGGLLDYTAHRGGEEKGGGRTLRKLPNHPARLRFSYFPPRNLRH
jgi:hypothetical protein